MQRLGGLLLIVSGLSLGTYTFLPPPQDSEQTLREITRISAAPDRVKPHDQGRLVWVEPVVTAAVPVPVPAVRPKAAPAPSSGASSKPNEDDRQLDGWTAVVTASTSQKPMTSSQPGDDATRSRLTRDLQLSLQKLGCYAGEINGAWTPSTKRAMSNFLERVNASLPVHQPDYILLTMVQSHRGQICGEGCPAGQSAGINGRCLPDGVVAARAAKTSKRLALNTEAAPDNNSKTSAPRALRVEPNAPAQTAALDLDRAPAPGRDDRDIAGTLAGSEQLPWLAEDNLSVPVPAPRRIRRPDGMMAIGAGQLPPADLNELPSVTGELRRAKPARKRANVVLYEDGFSDANVDIAPAARPKSQNKKKSAAGRKPQAPAIAAKPKQKYIYYAGGRRGGPRPGSPAFNMMQAMGGIY